MGGKCFKEINIANSIHVSREKEKEPQAESNVNLIQMNHNNSPTEKKNKDTEPASHTKKSYKSVTVSSSKISKEENLIGQRKSKVFAGVHNMKNNDSHIITQTYKN